MQDGLIDFFEVFPWNPNFETRISEVDEQHKQLVHLLNQLAAHFAHRSEPLKLNEVFTELANYADFHFQSEEKIWQPYFDDDLWFTSHQQVHRSFMESVIRIREQEESKSLDEIVGDLLKFLTRWLAFHILDSDMRMAKTIDAIRSGLSLEQAKLRADQEMGGSMQVLIETVLTMYDTLSSRTLDLMREKIERQKTELELKQEKEKVEQAHQEISVFKKLADASGQGICMLALNKDICYLNPALQKILAMDEQESLLQTCFTRFYPEATARQVDDTVFPEVMKNGNWTGELSILTSCGQTIPTIENYFLIHDAHGDPLYLGIVITDISENKRMLDALTDARNQAEQASNTKSAFLANMSHEIRTPLNAIIGMTHLMLNEAEPGAKRKDQLTKVLNSGQHLLSLINDILDISKIDAGKLIIEAIPFCLNSIPSNVVSMFKEQAEKKKLAINVEQEDRLFSVIGDPTRLTQILINLVGNAVKFTANGFISVRIILLTEDEDNLMFRIEVQDTGMGISPEMQIRLFDEFEQADSKTTRQFGGSGLGLAVCKRLVKAMNGEIGLESRLYHGSKFWFELTFQKSKDEVNPSLQQDKLKIVDKTEMRKYFGTHVLLVEDDPINCEVAQGLLNQAGLVVTTTNNGANAVRFIKNYAKDVDLILMDIQMPIMDGLEATRRIRQLEQGKEIPIIAMTANAFIENQEACFLAGMNDFVSKPVDVNHLYATLSSWLPEQGVELDNSNLQNFSINASTETAHQLNHQQLNQIYELLSPENGFNRAYALRLLQGDLTMYIRLLNNFISTHGQAADKLKIMLEQQKITDMQNLAHTLKGSAGSLGLSQTQAAVTEIELHLKTENAAQQIEADLSELAASISCVAEVIKQMPDTEQTQAKKVDSDIKPDSMQTLLTALQHADADAYQLMNQSREQLNDLLGEQAMSVINDIESFNYPAAAQTLKKVIDSLNKK